MAPRGQPGRALVIRRKGWTTPSGSESSEVLRPICPQELLSCLRPRGRKNRATHAIPGLNWGRGLQSPGKGYVAPSLKASPRPVLLPQLGNTEAEAPSGYNMPPKATSEGPAKSWGSTYPAPAAASSLLVERQQKVTAQRPSSAPSPPSHHSSSPDAFRERAVMAGGDFPEGRPWRSAEPAHLFPTCTCPPVRLPRFMNATICRSKISFLSASCSMAAGSRRRGRWGLKASAWSLGLE